MVLERQMSPIDQKEKKNDHLVAFKRGPNKVRFPYWLWVYTK